MPTARESLLEAAHDAVVTKPWSAIRMVDVAAAAGVSRQTLYNEFGSKEGLGAALVGRMLEGFLDGAARAAADAGRRGDDPAGCCAAAAGWILRTARAEPIVHAALTGCWGARFPSPGLPSHAPLGRVSQAPGELAARLRDRTVAELTAGGAFSAAAARSTLDRACEAGLRVALSYVVAPQERPGPRSAGTERWDAPVVPAPAGADRGGGPGRERGPGAEGAGAQARCGGGGTASAGWGGPPGAGETVPDDGSAAPGGGSAAERSAACGGCPAPPGAGQPGAGPVVPRTGPLAVALSGRVEPRADEEPCVRVSEVVRALLAVPQPAATVRP